MGWLDFTMRVDLNDIVHSDSVRVRIHGYNMWRAGSPGGNDKAVRETDGKLKESRREVVISSTGTDHTK